METQQGGFCMHGVIERYGLPQHCSLTGSPAGQWERKSPEQLPKAFDEVLQEELDDVAKRLVVQYRLRMAASTDVYERLPPTLLASNTSEFGRNGPVDRATDTGSAPATPEHNIWFGDSSLDERWQRAMRERARTNPSVRTWNGYVPRRPVSGHSHRRSHIYDRRRSSVGKLIPEILSTHEALPFIDASDCPVDVGYTKAMTSSVHSLVGRTSHFSEQRTTPFSERVTPGREHHPLAVPAVPTAGDRSGDDPFFRQQSPPPESEGGASDKCDLFGRTHSKKTMTMNTIFSGDSVGSNHSKRSMGGAHNCECASVDVDDLTFEILPLWSNTKPQMLKSAARTLRSANIPQLPDHSGTGASATVAGAAKYLPPVVSPNSIYRLMWDLMSIICIIHDAAVAPLEFLQVPQDATMRGMDWCARLFWTADIVATFFTGVQLADGTVELRRCKIAMHYLITWLLLDTIIVLVDWMAVLLDAVAAASQLIGLLRMLRLVRLLRLQKLVKVATERARSERVSLLLNLLGSVGAIVGVAHAMASAWLGLGRARPHSWVTALGLKDDEYLVQYLVAFHWSVTNFAGSMDMDPVNAAERVFAVFSLLVGFLIASWMVSSITSNMTRLSIISSKKTVLFATLNKYLKEHGISGDLVRRVLLNAKHAYSTREDHMQETDVELLAIVSEPLRAEVHLEIFSPSMVCHPLFFHLKMMNLRAMQMVCHSCVSLSALEGGDIAFSRGEIPHYPKMLFVISGSLEYARDEDSVTAVTSGQWISEQVLWTKWIYHGNLQATGSCRILVLDGRMFWRLCRTGELAGFEMNSYASRYISYLNSGLDARSDIGNEKEILRITQEVFGGVTSRGFFGRRQYTSSASKGSLHFDLAWKSIAPH